MPAAAALSLPAAASLPAVNDAVSDKKLRRLWSKYLNDVAEWEAVCAKYDPARAAFEVELPPCPEDVLAGDHWRAHQWLWNKHGLEPLWDAWNVAHDEVGKTVKAIQRTRADSFFGLGVKLTALPIEHDEDDLQDAVKSVLQDIRTKAPAA
jgi:hypothetical protein